ncbi:MAG: hypothetical protein HOY78_46270 [Saccharothrix sp.]|nr:hypothetical protein [Saccharothrix sp.]
MLLLLAYEGTPGLECGAVGRFAASRPLTWFDDFSLFASARDRFLHRHRHHRRPPRRRRAGVDITAVRVLLNETAHP